MDTRPGANPTVLVETEALRDALVGERSARIKKMDDEVLEAWSDYRQRLRYREIIVRAQLVIGAYPRGSLMAHAAARCTGLKQELAHALFLVDEKYQQHRDRLDSEIAALDEWIGGLLSTEVIYTDEDRDPTTEAVMASNDGTGDAESRLPYFYLTIDPPEKPKEN